MRRINQLYGVRWFAPALLLILIPIAGSRWATYIGVGPIYICDVLLVLSYFRYLSTRRKLKTPTPAPFSWIVFVVYLAIRVAFSLPQLGAFGPLDLLRDSVPFAYSVALLFGQNVANSETRVRDYVAKALYFGLSFHIWWASIALLSHSVGFQVAQDLFQAPIMQVRPDFDTAISAVGIAVSLRRVMVVGPRLGRIATILLGLASLVTVQTRAGLIAFIAMLALVLIALASQSNISNVRRVTLVLLGTAGGTLAIIGLASTVSGMRLLTTFLGQPATDDNTIGAIGTSRARSLVWEGVLDWMGANPVRQLFGSGFGNNFLVETDTLSFLEGTTYSGVRSPHNYFIGVYARMGLIGLILVMVLVAAAFVALVKLLPKLFEDELLFTASILFVTLLVVGTLGVVLEAPFGALPFYWAGGVILGTMSRLKWSKLGVSRQDPLPDF